LVFPLGAQGRPFAATDSKKSVKKCSKDDLEGILKTSIFPFVFWCFQRLATPSGAPSDGLEASWGELGAQGGHFWDTCAPVWVKVLA
jgi:hypothetical protein